MHREAQVEFSGGYGKNYKSVCTLTGVWDKSRAVGGEIGGEEAPNLWDHPSRLKMERS